MSKPSISNSIIGKIKEENITPLPSWWFHLQYGFFWILFFLALVFGSIAFSLILYFLFGGDILLAQNPFARFVEMIPLLWVGSFILLVGIGIWGLKHTHTGYKIPVWTFVGINMGASFVLGLGWFFSGVPEWIDTHASRVMPIHHSLDERREKLLNKLENGPVLIHGVVQSIQKDHVVIQTKRGKRIVITSPAKSFGNELYQGKRIQVKVLREKDGTIRVFR